MHFYRRLLTIIYLTLLVLLPVVHAADDPPGGQEALQWWIDRADHGDPSMQYGLGQLYAMGNPALGIQRDESQAAVWFRRAAEQGNAEAQFALGLLYEDGLGVPHDEHTALSWYRKAADQGHVIAREKVRAAETANEPLSNTALTPAKEEVTTSILSSIFVNRTNFWDWWQGALALAFITLAFWWILRVPLGVSSSWDRIVHWREEEEFARKERVMFENSEQINDAMLAETIAQFGQEAVAKLMNGAKTRRATRPVEQRQIPWQAHVTFLAMMMIGGLLASVMRGEFHLQLGLGADYARLFGNGPHIWFLLLVGGFLVGFGTRMAGGCTSGHGLSGCSRLQPGSLVGTMAFFGTAVFVSLVLEKLL
ncbi:MAG: YeeE/YedE thiosulfate transporter family protein [Sulfuricaulis sp.]